MEAVDAVLVVLFTIECVLESGRRARRKSKVVSKNHTSQNSMGSYHKYLSRRIAGRSFTTILLVNQLGRGSGYSSHVEGR